MIFLPNAANVVIEPQKLNYLLTHPGKSIFFNMMGFDRSRPHELGAALRRHVLTNEITQVFITIHGAKFTVRCNMPSPNGRNPVHPLMLDF